MIDRRSLLLAGLFASVAGPTLAQSKYPNRPVTIVNPFAAGGYLDALARLMGNRMQASFGQPFIVENKVGAGSTIGAQYVTRATPDGNTLLLGTTSSFVIAPYIYQPQPYDPLTSLAPIIGLTEAATVLVASEASGFKTLNDLLTAAKRKPGSVTVASAGNGSFPHIFSELFCALTGVELTHVPYRGGGPAMNDLIGGQVNLFFEVVASAMPQIQSKRAVPLLVSGNTRSAQLPDVPCAAELGYPDLNLMSWSGLAAPAGTPSSILELLNKECNETLKSEEMKIFVERLGYTILGGSAKDMADRIKKEAGIYKQLIASRGLSVK